MRTLIPAAGVLAVALGLLVPAGPAQAKANHNYLTVTYKATGTSTVAKTSSSIKLGPATLKTRLYPDATFTGSLPLPATSTSFKAAGLVPISATVTFVQKGKVTGSIRQVGKRTVVTSHAKDYIKLSDVLIAGVIPGFVGDSCQTAEPVALTVKTPAGTSFNVNKGGTLTGTFSIGKFKHCGLQTPIINSLVPGDGNTITLKLSDAKLTV